MMRIRTLLPPFVGLALCLSSWQIVAQEPSRTIEVHAHRFALEPTEITVTKGQLVKIKLISDDVPHSLAVKELGMNVVATKSNPGQASFTPVRAGDFQGRCGRFCGSGHGKMTFTIHVTEK